MDINEVAVTVLWRMWKNGNPVAFMTDLEGRLPGYKLRFILGTNAEDPLGDVAKKAGAQVVESDMSRFDLSVTELRNAAKEYGDFTLFISPGVEITQQDLQAAMKACRSGIVGYSWQLGGQLNDGSCPGKFGYNTCWLDSPEGLMLQPDLPDYVNNGVLPDLSVAVGDNEYQTGKCGGGEETVAMILMQRKDPTAHFIHNASRIIPMAAKTGTNVSFDWKIFRKRYVAKVYLSLFGMDESEFSKLVTVI